VRTTAGLGANSSRIIAHPDSSHRPCPLRASMALRPNASPFAPGTGGQPSSSALSKQAVFSSSSSPSPAPSSSAVQSIPNKTPARPPPKTKGLPRGNQNKRAQTQRGFGKKGRLGDDALTADPIVETVCHFPVMSVNAGIGDVWFCEQERSNLVESSLEFLYSS